MLAFAASAQDDNPTVAILRYGPVSSYEVSEGAIIDMLESHAFINADERAVLDARRQLEGEKLNIFWGDGAFDFATVNLMVEEALDQEPDVLLTIGLPVMQIAIGLTAEYDEPPVVLFTSVFHPATASHEVFHPEVDVNAEYNPFAGGTAPASCLKADHVSGVETETTYGRIVPLLRLQKPDIQSIGVIHSSSETSGLHGAEDIMEHSEELGITVEIAAVASISELSAAAESLISRGVEAFFIPADLITIRGMPILTTIAIENGLPVFHATMGAIFDGATVGAGSSQYYAQGVDVTRILIGYLNGDIDIATTGIYVQDAVGVGLNLDSASDQNVVISQALYDLTDIMIEDGELRVSEDALADPAAAEELRRLAQTVSETSDIIIAPELQEYVDRLTAADLRQGNRAFLERLYCSPERIAEEEAQVAQALEEGEDHHDD